MKSNVLHLTLKKKWFDMTRDGIKREEYREIKPYWVKRLCVPDGHGFRPFTHVIARHGYASDAPQILRRISEIVAGEGRPEWGAEPGKKYFIIRYE